MLVQNDTANGRGAFGTNTPLSFEGSTVYELHNAVAVLLHLDGFQDRLLLDIWNVGFNQWVNLFDDLPNGMCRIRARLA